MEAFRTRYSSADSERMLVAPVSFGCSSLSLLRILSQHLDVQLKRTKRRGFALHVLYVDDSEVTGVPSYTHQIQQLQQKYPQHLYSTVPLHSVFLEDVAVRSSHGKGIDMASSASARLSELLKALPSATAKSDVTSILLSRAVVKFAKANNCEGILWGHSTTRLAEKVLSEAAKGRGFSVPWQVTDGPTPYGTSSYFPLRDVFKGELSEYITLTDKTMANLASVSSSSTTQSATSLRNSSIDLLTQRFFESTEASNPGIVSNVVRTSGKLQHTIVGTRRCKLCLIPVTQSQLGGAGWAGMQNDEAGLEQTHSKLCYGCARSVPEEVVYLLP
jgi:cytoplasmic tRNA 2-thiolation protein 2